MKKLIVVSKGKNTGDAIVDQVNWLTEERFLVELVLISNLANANLKCDLILYTSERIADFASEHFDENIPSLIASRVIDYKKIEKLISLPIGTDILLVNDDESTATMVIEQLTKLGIDYINYYPVYPGSPNCPKLSIAVTAGEIAIVPKFASNIIDIGVRLLDIRTIHELVSMLGAEKKTKVWLEIRYIKDIVKMSRSIDEKRRDAQKSEKLLETILNNVDVGMAYIDSSKKIVRVNSKFEAIFCKKKKDLIRKELEEVIDSVDIFSKEYKSLIIRQDKKELLIEIEQIEFQDDLGYLVIAKYVNKVLGHDSVLRRNYKKKITRKLHTFSDYLTVNSDVDDMIKRAEKFSKTDATMIIQGESGTGKEILAQAVHMNSYRKKNEFVPVNIAAITPNLLESELFGYEEGAFTGSRKGGKVGIFEIANGGTIFIDEIGDAPLDFQVKLLRVLQEKRIRRVGAIEEIPINVRVIVATNKNLINLIDKGEFREDLFFRLNTLPIKTVPLRRRKDDVIYLLMYFMGIYFSENSIKSLGELFDDEAREFLVNYRWRGNVRELINLLEYLSFIYEGETLGKSNLPYYMLEDENVKERTILDIHELWVLEEIEKNEGIGRSVLAELAIKQGIGLGEGKIRGVIKKLKDKKLMDNKERKRGCVISERGKRTLEDYK
ncbi:MAG: sigma 54-interacting transcriptional regulator [Clostridiales bacterium]|nr:sigma 54-interacting transcriptional regulator [Clostridiales bacterium]